MEAAEDTKSSSDYTETVWVYKIYDVVSSFLIKAFPKFVPFFSVYGTAAVFGILSKIKESL